MRPPDYEVVGDRHDAVPARASVATGGSRGLAGHLHVLVHGPADLPAGTLTVRHAETRRVVARVRHPDALHVGPDSVWRLVLVDKVG